MAEECADGGYAEATVAGVAKRAGVSSLTFYKQFADKRACMLVAHRQLLGRLLEAVDRGNGEEGDPGTVRSATVRTTLALLAADAPSAQVLTVEILAAGPEGVKLHDAMVSAFAERLEADWVRAAGMLALVGKRVVADEADLLPELEDELIATLA
jgi:AcrR family transcriptional regulator